MHFLTKKVHKKFQNPGDLARSETVTQLSFAYGLIPSLFRVSPGLFFENAILVLALRHPVLMSPPSPGQPENRVSRGRTDGRTSILGTSPHKGPYGAKNLC